MTKKAPRKAVDRGEAGSYAAAGHEFARAAELARAREYWNAAGLLLVHSAIAYADAVCIGSKGVKSTSENHLDAVTLLAEVTSKSVERDRAVQHLRRLIEQKNRAAYTGISFRAADVERLAIHAERFDAWAKRLLTR